MERVPFTVHDGAMDARRPKGGASCAVNIQRAHISLLTTGVYKLNFASTASGLATFSVTTS